MSKPKQTKLFDTLPVPPELSNKPVIAGAPKDLDPEQRRFNKLSKEVQKLREDLAGLQARAERFRKRVLEDVFPELERMQSARVGFVKSLDALLTRPAKEVRLTGKRREALKSCLLWILESIMLEVDDPEIIAIHDRHSPISAADGKELKRDLARAMVEDMYGPDALEGFEGDDLEGLFAHVRARHEEMRARRQTKKSARKAQELAQAQEEAHHAVREVYRKLASQLHPDREADEALRRQKTDLMQRANKAYEKGDLLSLLTLQLECEQLDADRLAELPLERLKRYNHALQEQVRALKEEKAEILGHLAEVLEHDPRLIEFTDDALLHRQLEDKIETLRHTTSQLEDWIAGLADPARRNAVCAAILQQMQALEDELGLDELALLFMDDDSEPATPAKPKARRKKSRRR